MTTAQNKLVLGTVQLGMQYGVNNSHGQPSTDEAFAILDAAFAEGIDTFDTASGYGSAEEVLGAWMRERGLAEKVRVVSKMGTPDELTESLKRLGVESLDGYLLHKAEDMEREEKVAELKRVKAEGLVQNIGVSVYSEHEALRALELDFDYVQVPYNAFDQRLDATDFFNRAKEKGVTVFARSPFLQGLLVMNPSELPQYLAGAQEPLEAFIKVAQEYQLSQTQAALLFALSGRADHTVFGVETLAQLQEILEIARTPLPSGFREAVQSSVRVSDSSVLNPSLWHKI